MTIFEDKDNNLNHTNRTFWQFHLPNLQAPFSMSRKYQGFENWRRKLHGLGYEKRSLWDYDLSHRMVLKYTIEASRFCI